MIRVADVFHGGAFILALLLLVPVLPGAVHAFSADETADRMSAMALDVHDAQLQDS